MDDNPNDLSDGEINDYLWLIEQLLQEVRQHQCQRQTALAQENPVKRLPSVRVRRPKTA